jgi:MFS transporter
VSDTGILPPPGPARRLALAHLADAAGNGLFLSGSAVYFTRVTGLSTTEVGLGLSAAGLAGAVGGVVLGRIADRRCPRTTLLVLLVAQALAFALYPAVHSPVAFLAVVVPLGFAEAGCGPVFGALVAHLAGPADRVVTRGRLRVLFNIGFAAGAGLAGVALAGPGRLVAAIPAGNGASFLLAAALVTGIPRVAARTAACSAKRRALRDVAFLRIVALSGVLALHASTLLVALPLWTVTRTAAPRWIVPVLLLGNAGLVIAFQVRVTRRVSAVADAARAARMAAAAFTGGCALAALAGAAGRVGAVACLVGAVALLTGAEMAQSASGWALSYGLSPDDAHGEYQGVFALHMTAQMVVGPALLTGVAVAHGMAGWLVTAGLVTVAGGLMAPAVRAAERRPVPPATEPAPGPAPPPSAAPSTGPGRATPRFATAPGAPPPPA